MRLAAFVCLGLVWLCDAFAGQKIVYESSVSGQVTQVLWDMEKKEDRILLEGKSSKSEVTIECLPDYSFLRYQEKSAASKELEISKEGPLLVIKSREGGKEKIRSCRIGKTPWVQDFKFGFRSFLASQDKEASFYIVNPKDLEAHEMVIIKEFDEKVEVGGKPYNAQRVKVTLKGFRKKFWKAYVWFDKESLFLVKYRANEGPGTPYTETVLVQGA